MNAGIALGRSSKRIRAICVIMRKPTRISAVRPALRQPERQAGLRSIGHAGARFPARQGRRVDAEGRGYAAHGRTRAGAGQASSRHAREQTPQWHANSSPQCASASHALSQLVLLSRRLSEVVAPQPVTREPSAYYAENAYLLAKGKNVVNVILVDFRGFDTLVEITVLTIAAIGVYSMLKLKISPTEKE